MNETITNIPLGELHPFPDHPFGVRDDEAMEQTVGSIREYGVLVPAIARPREEGGYELIAGHRRKHACELAGLETMPVIVRDLDRNAAVIIMVDSNIQRENILPSERAKAYKMKLEAIKRQGARHDLTSTQIVQKLSVDKVAEEAGTNREQVCLLQEEVESRTVTLAVNATKMTANVLKQAISKYLAHCKEKKAEKAREGPVKPCGKQSVKQLVGQNQGVSNIEITDKNIKDFERIARKYGVDFALKKDKTGEIPKYLVFFKARDGDALTAAFKEYTAKTDRKKEKPSVVQKLRTMSLSPLFATKKRN